MDFRQLGFAFLFFESVFSDILGFVLLVLLWIHFSIPL
jgi:hypothetical protein